MVNIIQPFSIKIIPEKFTNAAGRRQKGNVNFEKSYQVLAAWIDREYQQMQFLICDENGLPVIIDVNQVKIEVEK